MTTTDDRPVETSADLDTATRLRLRRYLVEEFTGLAEDEHTEEIDFFLTHLTEDAVEAAHDLRSDPENPLSDWRDGTDELSATAICKTWSIWLIYSRQDIEVESGFENMFEALATIMARMDPQFSAEPAVGFHLFATASTGIEVRFAHHR